MVSGVRQEDSYIAIRYLHDTQGYPIRKLCAAMSINRSSYYKWLKRSPSTNQTQNEEIIGLKCPRGLGIFVMSVPPFLFSSCFWNVCGFFELLSDGL